MFPVLQIGPASIQTSGLLLLAGIWIGLNWIERNLIKTKWLANIITNLVLFSILFGLLGARLSYVIQHLSAFWNTPLNILAFSPTMLDPWGGVLFGSLTGLIYGQKKHLPLFQSLDVLTPFFMVMGLAWGLANLASGEGYGAPTRMPWGFELWGAFRHPSQVYESVAALIVIMVIWRQRRENDIAGITFFRFLALTSVLRLFLEAYRGDSLMLTSFLRLAQVVAWFALAFALRQLGLLIKRQNIEADNMKEA